MVPTINVKRGYIDMNYMLLQIIQFGKFILILMQMAFSQAKLGIYSRNSALLLLQILFCLERKSLKPRYMCTCMLGSNEILSLNKHKNSASLFHCFMNINTSHKPKLLGSDHVQMTKVFLRFCLQSTLVI